MFKISDNYKRIKFVQQNSLETVYTLKHKFNAPIIVDSLIDDDEFRKSEWVECDDKIIYNRGIRVVNFDILESNNILIKSMKRYSILYKVFKKLLDNKNIFN